MKITRRVLVTGALGQIGSELTTALCERYGYDNVVATDLKDDRSVFDGRVAFEPLDVMKPEQIDAALERHRIDTVYHLAAVLSAIAEMAPLKAWHINMDGLFYVLEAARTRRCAVFFPSSIGAFGPTTPLDGTPQDTIQRPNTMYGVTKVSGELLCDYFHKRYGVDTRGVRFPGIISNVTPPGGGTTDYAVTIFYEAIKRKRYACILRGDTSLDMMYMPDAIKAAIMVMEADPSRLRHRNSFNVTAMHFTPEVLAAEIRKHIPEFVMDYKVDEMRQAIADSWPNWMDDRAAREEWDWAPDYDLPRMTADMIAVLRDRSEANVL
jgi:nucleoside-diphosphate-sugar epimerase